VKKVVKMIKTAKIGEPKRYSIQIENIVASAKLPSRLNLDKIAFELENSEYEPEQFPGLVYRMKNPKVAFLLFSSGKIVCTGVRKVEDIESSVKTITKKLKSINALKK
jgi:transcription initiation factor TFIID TATA-box-binding protein